MLPEKEQEGRVGTGRTIITGEDVRKAREARERYIPPHPVLSPSTSVEAWLDKRKPEEEEEPEEELGGEERREEEDLEAEDLEEEEGGEEESERDSVGRLWHKEDTSPPYARVDPLSQRVDNYTDRLLKYIPAESVALYLTLQGIVSSSVEGRALYTWLWFAFGIGIIGTPLYLWRVQQVSKRVQLAVSTAAFSVWVFALGGAFASLPWYEPFLGSMLLVIFTFFVPLLSPDVLSSEEPA
jgi:hypothetical protein